jgi:drug/metabolite transporter, DME family
VESRRDPLGGAVIVVVAASLFGMLGVLSRTSYDLGLTPFTFVAWRAGLGALVTAGFVGWGLRRGARLAGWRTLDARGRVALSVAALMASTLNMAMFLAFARIPIAVVLLCFYLYPAIVAAVSAVFGWERLDRNRVVALGLALAGMAAVVVGGSGGIDAAGGLDPVGVLLALSAALSQSVFVLVSRRGYSKVPSDQAMGFILAVAAIIGVILALAAGEAGPLALPLGSASLFGLMVFGGIFVAAVPSALFLAGIRWIGPIRAGILMLIEPLVGVALAAALLQESISAIQALGGAMILVAAVLIQRARPAEPTILPEAEVVPAVGTEGAPDLEAVGGPEAASEAARP